MIGRDGPVDRFELQRWARAQALDPRMTPVASHLLLLLVTWCDEGAMCYPGVATLVKLTKRDRATVYRALRLLEDLRLVWSRQQGKDPGGRGRPALRELLFNPATDSLTEPAMREAISESSAVAPTRQQDDERERDSSRTTQRQQSHGCDTEQPVTTRTAPSFEALEKPQGNNQRSSRTRATADDGLRKMDLLAAAGLAEEKASREDRS